MDNFKRRFDTKGKIYFNGQPMADYIGEIEIERRLREKPLTFTDKEVRGFLEMYQLPPQITEYQKRCKDAWKEYDSTVDSLPVHPYSYGKQIAAKHEVAHEHMIGYGKSCFDDGGDWE